MSVSYGWGVALFHPLFEKQWKWGKWREQHENKVTKSTHVSRLSRIWLQFASRLVKLSPPHPGLSFPKRQCRIIQSSVGNSKENAQQYLTTEVCRTVSFRLWVKQWLLFQWTGFFCTAVVSRIRLKWTDKSPNGGNQGLRKHLISWSADIPWYPFRSQTQPGCAANYSDIVWELCTWRWQGAEGAGGAVRTCYLACHSP